MKKSRVAWNKGLTKETDKRVAKYSCSRSKETKEAISKAQKTFSNEQEQQICNEYFSEEKPSTVTLGKKWKCKQLVIRSAIIRNGYILRPCGEGMRGKHHSAITKQKMRNKLTGKNNPMFGKHRSKETKRKISIGNKDKIVSEKTKQKQSENTRGENNPMFGIHRFGEKAPNYGNHHSEKSKRKIIEGNIAHIQTHPGPFKNTKPELKMKEILNDLNIPFEHQFRLKNHIFDFHIPNTNILIEVDGDYWHGNPKMFRKLSKRQLKQKQRDIKNNQLAKENNYILLRFWENDILKNNKIIEDKLRGINA